MKRIICLAFLFILIGTSSCKKFLAANPESFIAPETYYTTGDQLQTALNGVYSVLGQTDGALYQNNLYYAMATPTDEMFFYTVPRTNLQSFLYDASDNNVALLWRGCYSGIERANILLASINKPTMDETQRNLILGQTIFLRAYYYFLLVSYFGDVPLILKPTASLDDVNVARTPSKIVYDQILADMTTAEGLLQAQTVTALGYGGKVTKTAVEGILARVCLKMAGYPLQDVSKYQDAINWCQKVINSGEHSLNPDYKQVFINYALDKYDTKESIWEVEFWGNGLGTYNNTGLVGQIIGLTNIGDLNIGYSGCMLRTTLKLYNLYNVDPTTKVGLDLRRDWNCCNYGYSGNPGVKAYSVNVWQYYPGKWRREYEVYLPKAKNSTPQNACILRYSDVLLMLAEAENEVNGPTTTAYNAINQVRERAYGSGSRVSTIAVTNGGSGYTVAPTVTFSSGTGTSAVNNTATATATISGGKVTAITIVSAGANYTTPPTITITGTGTGATATATITAINPAAADLPTGLSKDNFRLALQDERSKELCFEFQRNQDLIRWGLFVSTIKGMVNYVTVNSGPATAIVSVDYNNISARNVLWPIPSHEISLNKSLTQNPGY